MTSILPKQAQLLALCRNGAVPLRQVLQPSRLLLGFAATAAVANTMALAADPAGTANPAADGGRLGASLQTAKSARDKAIAAERRKLDMREQALKAGEARLADQAQNSAQQQQAQQPGRSRGGANASAEPAVPYDRLASIYQRMKPAQAAPIFERLDLEVQTQVAQRMREQVTAQIMGKMSPDAAVMLSMSLAGRKVIQPKLASAAQPKAKGS